MKNERTTVWILRSLAEFFLVPCILSPIGQAKQIDDSRLVYRFDAGPQETLIEESSVALHPHSIYEPETGFGWTAGPLRGFQRPELSRSRNALTIDGVTGKHLAWRANIASGNWFVTVWLESTPSDTPPIQLLIHHQQQKLAWQKFTPPAEPRRSPPKTYRVFQAATHVGADGFSLELIGEEQEVRLLGISLIRNASDMKPAHQNFLAQLKSAGRHDSNAPLHDLSQQAKKILATQPADTCFAVWHEQLALLIEAERLFEMRGWEWATVKTGLGMFDRLYQAVIIRDMQQPALIVDRLLCLSIPREFQTMNRSVFVDP